MEELMAALEKNNSLRERSVQLADDPMFSAETQPPSSSTMREDFGATRNESLLVTTLSNWTLSNIYIPECTPLDGEGEIDKRAFDYWKDIFHSSIKIVNATDEQTMFGLFKIKAGPKLRDIFFTTVSGPGMSCEATAPFSNAMERLNDYFGSRTNILAQRGKLMSLSQNATENSMQFVRRVSTAAKLCNYTDDEEMEAVVRVITKGALDSRVRVLAHRNWVKQGSMKDLIDLVRDRELEKANEEEFQRNHGKVEVAKVAAISQQPYGTPWQSQGNFRPNLRFGGQRSVRGFGRGGGRGFGRGRSAVSRNHIRNYESGSVNNCWRCGSIFHHPYQCPGMQKVCHNCGRMGHIARICPSIKNQAAHPNLLKRRNEFKEEAIDTKIAVIEKEEDEDITSEVRGDNKSA